MGEEQGKTLRQRYMRYKTINIPNTQALPLNVAEVLNESERKSKSLEINESSENSAVEIENKKLTCELNELKAKYEQVKVETLEYQREIDFLKSKLKDQEKIIKNKNKQISELEEKEKIFEQTKNDLLLTKKELNESNKTLQHFEDLSKQEKALNAALESSVKEMSRELEKQRNKNIEYQEKISSLTKSSAEASNMRDELEACLSEETAKTAKVQEELEFVIKNINKEKEVMRLNFQDFRNNIITFLSCTLYGDSVLKLFEEKNKGF